MTKRIGLLRITRRQRPSSWTRSLPGVALSILILGLWLTVLETKTTVVLRAEAQPANDRHQRDRYRKMERDRTFRELSDGVITIRKRSYASMVDGLEIPVYIFEPLDLHGASGHAAFVWVHGGVHGDLDPMCFPFIREAVDRGYVLVAPEYRGSTGYGREHYEAIDYGGYEIEDCLTAVSYIAAQMPYVDPDRLGIIGWSHGGFIALHSVFRDQTPFKAAAALVPVSNLVFRLAYKGPTYANSFLARERIDGPVHEKRDVYVERSPVYHVDRLQTPLLVHIADNDHDVNFEEAQ